MTENFYLPVPLAAQNWRLRETTGDILDRGRLITQTFTLGMRMAEADPTFADDMRKLTVQLSDLDGHGRFPPITGSNFSG